MDADDNITAAIQGLENDIENENGIVHDLEGDDVTCKSDFCPSQPSNGASLHVSITVLVVASTSLLLSALFCC